LSPVGTTLRSEGLTLARFSSSYYQVTTTIYNGLKQKERAACTPCNFESQDAMKTLD